MFVLASFFSFALLVHLFGFAGRDSFGLEFMYGTGKILSGAYGFCSVLIPIFFFGSSMVAFSGHRTFKKCVYISFSLIPFFTAVGIERVYRSLTAGYAGVSSFKTVQLVLAFVIGFLLVVIEYLLAGIVAERIFFGVEEAQSDIRIKSFKEEFEPLHYDEPEEETSNESGYDDEVEGENGNEAESEAETEQGLSAAEQFAALQAQKAAELDQKYLHEFDDLQLTGIKVPEKFQPKEEKKEEIPQVQEKPAQAAPAPAAQAAPAAETVPPATSVPAAQNVSQPEPSVERAYSYAEPVAPAPVKNPEPIEISRETKSAVEEVPVEVRVTTDGIEINEDEEENEYDADDYPNYEEEEEIEEESEADVDAENNDEESQEDAQEEIEDDPNQRELIEEGDDFDIEVDASDEEEAQSGDDTVSGTELDEEEFEIDVTPEKEENDGPVPIEDEKTLTAVNPRLQEKAAKVEAAASTAPSADTVPAPVEKPKPEPKPEPKIIDSRFTRGVYKIPTDKILNEFENSDYWVIDEGTNASAAQLKETLEEFRISAEVTGIRKGPVVTMFEILPAPGVKLSKIVTLQDNIALRLAAKSVRIVAPIPGKRAVGIEVPNKDRAVVAFREIIEQELPEFKKMAVPVILGKDIQGEAQVIDLSKTPHLLIAGSTGSGKSVCVNSLILSILYKRSPEQVKLILVDPKIVELKLYNDIPHLLTPVITEPKRALQSLQYCLCEMERRYALLDGMGVRDIISYNKRIEERHIASEKLPYIVVIIDEFADLMATTGKELENTIARLCAMSRAVGIHLVLATQRPSVDVITGLIKANIPSRIAFAVASKMDSRIIIDQVGAEKLLGRGDMLFVSAVNPVPIRIQGTLVSDDEVENVVNYVKQYGFPEYIDDEIFVDDEDEENPEPGLFDEGDDPLYQKALDIVIEAGKASASYIQRRLKIGYNRAARLVEEMEERGIVGPANGSKPREIIHMP